MGQYVGRFRWGLKSDPFVDKALYVVLFISVILCLYVYSVRSQNKNVYTKDYVIHCLQTVVDLNHDKKLSFYEVDKAWKTHLTFMEKSMTFYITSSKQIFDQFDKNKDEFIDSIELSSCLTNEILIQDIGRICVRQMQTD